jgi:predicted nucleotidyltransferase
MTPISPIPRKSGEYEPDESGRRHRQAPILALVTPREDAALAEVSARSGELSSVVRVVAFGSRVRGDFRGDSDMDLLVIVRDISSRDEVISFLYRIEEIHDVPLAPVIYTMREYEENRRLGSTFVVNVEREGKVLYDAQQG